MSDEIITKSEQAIAKGSQSFAAAARLFDRQTRDDAVMLYAWCRHCDDVIDGQILGMTQVQDYRDGQQERLAQLEIKTVAALSGTESGDYIFDALRRVVSRHDIPHVHPLELLAGFGMDVGVRRYDTINETLEYCYHVAGVVGVMMAMIMGTKDPATLDRACDLGIAFQLTNIARDVIDDARVGRVYLPTEILQQHGLSVIDPEDRSIWPNLHSAALEMLDLADHYYSSSYHGMKDLPWRSAWAIAAARRVYAAIGLKLRQAGPAAWERRISTTRYEKALLLGLSLTDVGVTRFQHRPPPRDGLWERPRY